MWRPAVYSARLWADFWASGQHRRPNKDLRPGEGSGDSGCRGIKGWGEGGGASADSTLGLVSARCGGQSRTTGGTQAATLGRTGVDGCLGVPLVARVQPETAKIQERWKGNPSRNPKPGTGAKAHCDQCKGSPRTSRQTNVRVKGKAETTALVMSRRLVLPNMRAR